jgi:tRNA modification GTPase
MNPPKVPPAATGTIAARATPPGRGGIAVVRVSGPDCTSVAGRLLDALPAPRMASLMPFRDSAGEAIDTGLALYFPAPHSFTGEDVLELHCHGGPMVCDLVLEAALAAGARLAEPGEFTRRAFLNDKLDLSQAEAVADLIDSSSRAAARAAQRSLRGDFAAAVMRLNAAVTALRVHVEAALDFPDEDIDFLDDAALRARLDEVAQEFDLMAQRIRQGVLLRDGIRVVIAGRPNAGKSSLLNALAGYDAAIVTDIPGTTRDLVREQIDLGGLPLHVIDTAGLRDAPGTVEAEGIRRAREQLAQADHALLVIDSNRGNDFDELRAELPEGLDYTVVHNKIDLSGEPAGAADACPGQIGLSALTGDGLPALVQRLKAAVGFAEPGEDTLIARRRHLDALARARSHFDTGRAQLLEHRAGELMAEELLAVQNALSEITGEFSSDDLLGEIFSRFCIGK